MKSQLFQALLKIRYSYWFIPSLMAIGSIILAAVTVYVDSTYELKFPPQLAWLFSGKADGARAVLSTVAGSTITVAGVVFSMTIMAVSHATSNYGSRLLLKFLDDRQNQITLGVFIATFIYCLLVLRTVSGAEANGFIPHISVFVGLVLAILSVLVLIAFIHHVPDTIHIANVAAERGAALVSMLDRLFLKEKDQPALSDTDAPDKFENNVFATHSGYVQTIDIDGLRNYCSSRNLIAISKKQVGDFLLPGETLLRYNISQNQEEFNPEDACKSLHAFYGIGTSRTPTSDPRFLIEELTQIATRALSPGINDPFSAITCLDWLANAVSHVRDRKSLSNFLTDDQGQICLVMPAFNFSELCEMVFGRLRPYVVTDLMTSRHAASVLNRLIETTIVESNKKVLCEHASKYLQDSLNATQSESDQEQIRASYSRPTNPSDIC